MSAIGLGNTASARWLWILWERRPRRDAAADQSLGLTEGLIAGLIPQG
jgi:hypothetical protein